MNDILRGYENKKVSVCNAIIKHNKYCKDQNLQKLPKNSILRQGIWHAIDDLYKYSKINNIYFFDCASKVYFKEWDYILGRYLSENPDGEEIDCIEYEIKRHSNPHNERFICCEPLVKHYYNDHILGDSLELSRRKKIEWLSKKAEAIRSNKRIIKNKEPILPASSKIEKSNTREYYPFSCNEGKARWEEFAELRNVLNNNLIAKRGIGAVANAFFQNNYCKENYLLHKLSLEDWIHFLRTNYKAKLKNSKVLADPEIHSKPLTIFLTQHNHN